MIDETTGKDYKFHCGRWLARDEDDKQIMRELTCATPVTPRDEKEKIGE